MLSGGSVLPRHSNKGKHSHGVRRYAYVAGNRDCSSSSFCPTLPRIVRSKLHASGLPCALNNLHSEFCDWLATPLFGTTICGVPSLPTAVLLQDELVLHGRMQTILCRDRRIMNAAVNVQNVRAEETNFEACKMQVQQ
jgi:hypothetical protein